MGRLFDIILYSLCLFFLATSGGTAGQTEPVEEPADYRMSNYRAPVPLTVKGAKVIETAQDLQAFLQTHQKAALLDVYPAARKPENYPADDIWIEPRRETLTEALWLANVGRGVLSEKLESLFKKELERLTGGDRNGSVVIFCEPSCWHSWNAAKRAVSWGYENIYWYRQGVAGWRKAGLPLEEKQPVRP